MKAIFLRALEETEDKDRCLREAIASPEQAMGRTRFEVDTASFCPMPGSPFAYWTPPSIVRLFTSLGSLKQHSYDAMTGAKTNDDARFLRLRWEVAPDSIAVSREASSRRPSWARITRGGTFSPYYHDVHSVIEWAEDGRCIKAFVSDYRGKKGWGYQWSANLNGHDWYFKPGLTWPLRGIHFSSWPVPQGCLPSGAGKMAYAPKSDLPWLLAVSNSQMFDVIIRIFAGKVGGVQYEAGLLQQSLLPNLAIADKNDLGRKAVLAWSLKRALDSRTENSHAFHLPALLQMDGGQLSDRADAWSQHVADTEAELTRLQAEIDDRCFELYGIDGADRAQIERGLGGGSAEEDDASAEDDEVEISEAEKLDAAPLAASLLAWSGGVAFGRFDLRLATGERPAPPEPEPFDPLPVCSPGMLTGEDGLPLDTAPSGYAIDFPRDGILVDDASTPSDLVACTRQVFEHVFDDAAARWEEAAKILGQRDRTLRRWFARDFFGLHLKQYSKSRRKAPIYWPLSTASSSYTVWLYYPRLTADTLFQVVAEHLEPKLRKIQEERLQVDAAQGRSEGREAAKLAKQAGELAELEQELEEMKAELLRVAELPYKPNLNDGVQITAAPLSKLFQLKAWRKVLETTWKKLEKGDYDWAHLARAIWPDRVRDKCKTDRSLAIAHGLEDLCEAKTAPKKRRRSKGAT